MWSVSTFMIYGPLLIKTSLAKFASWKIFQTVKPSPVLTDRSWCSDAPLTLHIVLHQLSELAERIVCNQYWVIYWTQDVVFLHQSLYLSQIVSVIRITHYGLDVAESSLTNHRLARRFLPSENLRKPSFPKVASLKNFENLCFKGWVLKNLYKTLVPKV